MKKIMILGVLLVQFGLSGCKSPDEIGENDKRAILDISTQVMSASEDEDVPKIMSFLDEGVIIKVKKDGKEPYSYDYHSYASYLTQVFSIVSSYTYTRRNEMFRKGDAGEIIYEFELDESYVFDGNEINENHYEIWTVYKNGEKYRIARIDVR